MASITGAALFMGTDSGHGKGNGCSFQPGHGGGMVPGCPHSPLDPRISMVPVIVNEAVAMWPPMAQLPLGVAKALAARVVINGMIPMVDQDILTPHPTPTMFTTSSVGYQCFVTLSTPAWWCTQGVVGGREGPQGHGRKVMATTATVFIGKVRAGRFLDPLGDGTPAFPCLSLVSGCSKNVFIGL